MSFGSNEICCNFVKYKLANQIDLNPSHKNKIELRLRPINQE